MESEKSLTAKEIINLYYKDFKFRKYQKEAITFIIKTYMEDKNAKILLDAPTGAGKSIIALFSSNIISKHFNKTGYIITSETSLQKQYEYDIDKFEYKIPSVMGLNNYICSENHDTVNFGDCKLQFLTAQQRENLKCYPFCPYYSTRNRASESPIALLNYNYWLPQVNTIVNEEARCKKYFENRDFCFFDESHRIVRIVNSQYSPTITSKFLDSADKVLGFFASQGIISRQKKKEILDQFTQAYNLLKDEEDNYMSFVYIGKIIELFNSHIITFDSYLKVENEKYKETKDLPKENKSCMMNIESLKVVISRFQTFFDAIKGNENLILKNKISEDELQYYCKDESLLLHKYFHGKYGFGVFMSATFLDDDFFKEYAGFSDDVIILKIPSTFDYSKSKIFYSKKFNMSYNKKHLYIKSQIEEIDRIVEKYESGIIHTGSFAFVKELLTYSKSDKIKTYSNTSEKQMLIAELQYKKNFFLAGPSLLEGIDLPDDISRCQIFMKVPYPFLGDVFVKYMFDTNKKWYMWNTALNFVQGVGRSNRNEDDYCDTYILDSSFINVLRSGMIPQYLTTTIKGV